MSCFIKNKVFERGLKIIHHSCTCKPWSVGNRAPNCVHQFVTRRQSRSFRTEPWVIVRSPSICAFVQKPPWMVFSFNYWTLTGLVVTVTLQPPDSLPFPGQHAWPAAVLQLEILISSGFCWRFFSFYLSSPLYRPVMLSALWPAFQGENSSAGFLSRFSRSYLRSL